MRSVIAVTSQGSVLRRWLIFYSATCCWLIDLSYWLDLGFCVFWVPQIFFCCQNNCVPVLNERNYKVSLWDTAVNLQHFNCRVRGVLKTNSNLRSQPPWQFSLKGRGCTLDITFLQILNQKFLQLECGSALQIVSHTLGVWRLKYKNGSPSKAWFCIYQRQQ